MARIPAAFFLALAFSQVLAVIEVDYIENVIEQKRKDVGSTPGSRILSGWEASPGQLPHQVGLRQVDRAGGVTGCGGSVLHHAWVLTAAHCTGQSVTIVIRAGVTHMTTPQYLGESTEYYNFPTFDSSRPHIVQPNDVAMIKLRTPVVFTELLQRVRVQPSADAYRNYEGEVAVASGFGRLWTNGASPETLNWVHLRMVSNQNCTATFGSIITSTSICARYYNVSSQSVCQGDSGGPLVYTSEDGVPTLIGVTSFVAGGEFGCHSGLPAGFARPGPFLAWFQEITGIDFENLDEDQAPPTTTTEEPTTTTTTTEEPTTTTTEEPTTSTTEEPTTTTSTEKPITQPPEPESEEDKEVDNNSGEDSDSDSSSEEDDEMKDLLKRMEVLVKVKVRMNKLKKKHVIHEKH